MTTAPFWKMDPAAWELVAELLPKPWPRELAEMDLRHWTNEARRPDRTVPGARILSARWGWTHWKARQLLVEVDPCDRAAMTARTPRRTVAAQSPHGGRTVEEGGTPVIEDIPHGGRTVAARSPPSRDPLLEEAQEAQEENTPVSPLTGQLLHLVAAPPSGPPATPAPKPDRDAELWSQLMALLEGTGHGKALELTDDRRRRLRASVKALDGERDGAERLAMLWAWWLLGPNDWWRRTFAGGALLGKLLQPRNVDERALDVPDGWVWDGSFKAAPPQRASARGQPSLDQSLGVLAQVLAEIQAEESA